MLRPESSIVTLPIVYPECEQNLLGVTIFFAGINEDQETAFSSESRHVLATSWNTANVPGEAERDEVADVMPDEGDLFPANRKIQEPLSNPAKYKRDPDKGGDKGVLIVPRP